MAFTCGTNRRCVGAWAAGRRVGCPAGAPVTPAARTAQCTSCATLERSFSIATDTRMDDPRPFAVYLAHHGSAIKVGITAVERGASRLLEQGAFASVILSVGTLASARRSEHLLTMALGLPDRVTSARKRAARACPGTPTSRASDLLTVAAHVTRLEWPEGQIRRQLQINDHAADYGLPDDGLHPCAEVLPLAPGSTISGIVTYRVGTDLYLNATTGLALLDTRLLAGWAVAAATPGAAFTARLHALAAEEAGRDVLF